MISLIYSQAISNSDNLVENLRVQHGGQGWQHGLFKMCDGKTSTFIHSKLSYFTPTLRFC